MVFTLEALASAKAGDSAAINTIVGIALRVARSACGRFISNRTDVEDLAQTVAVKVFKHLSTCRAETESEFVGFVIRIARNTCFDFHRTSKPVDFLGDYDAPSGRSEFGSIEAGEILYAAAAASGTELEVQLAVAGCSLSEIGDRLGIGKRRAQRKLEMHKQVVLQMIAE